MSTLYASVETEPLSDHQPKNSSNWVSVGGILTSSPSAVVMDDGNISVLARSNEGLWNINSNNSEWGNWTLLTR